MLAGKRVSLLVVFLLGFALRPAVAAEADPWQAWRFLLGDWKAEQGGGAPGQASAGADSFHFELDQKILVRKSHSEYPATKDRPAFAHDDMMIIYPQASTGGTRAMYFDNEGHVIEYAAPTPSDGKVVLTSEAVPSAPRFRLTYSKLGADRISIKFEIAPPGKPEAFSTYVEGTARRSTRK